MAVEVIFDFHEDRPFSFLKKPIFGLVYASLVCILWFLYVPVMGYLMLIGELKGNVGRNKDSDI